MESRYCIAYGSNLNIEEMKMRCPNAKVIGTSIIKNYRLLFKGNKEKTYLTIVPSEGFHVPVAVWMISESDEAMLDAYEEYPLLYYKKEISLPVKKIKSEDMQIQTAFVYIMCEEQPMGFPTEHYLEICMQGYQNFGFDERILTVALNESKKVFLEMGK